MYLLGQDKDYIRITETNRYYLDFVMLKGTTTKIIVFKGVIIIVV